MYYWQYKLHMKGGKNNAKLDLNPSLSARNRETTKVDSRFSFYSRGKLAYQQVEKGIKKKENQNKHSKITATTFLISPQKTHNYEKRRTKRHRIHALRLRKHRPPDYTQKRRRTKLHLHDNTPQDIAMAQTYCPRNQIHLRIPLDIRRFRRIYPQPQTC